MVVICNATYPANSKYESYFELFPYSISDFQKYAIQSIVDGNHVLVTAHTGSGKTLPAEFAIQHFVGQGKKIIYTSPIKALSNQKYYEFTNKYPHIRFGLFTGDIKTNPEADVLIMTTEILMNYLFVNQDSTCVGSQLQFNIDITSELGCVIFDEVHYINDAERGSVWEKSILMLPLHIQMVMLSATIDNPSGFAQWIEDRDSNTTCKKSVWLASTNHRVVPLSHYGFFTTNESVFKTIKDKVIQKQIRDITNVLIPLCDHSGKFNDAGYSSLSAVVKILDANRISINRKHALNQLALFLRDREMLPAIAFVFSRKNVERFAEDITVPLLEFDSKVAYTVQRECEQIIRKLPNYQEYLELPEYISLVKLFEKGIGIHHSGMIPILREIVELMISKKYIKLLFATESFAIGLDCPIRTAVFTSLTKFDGSCERALLPHEYTQMAGRAGRRGIDTIGHVVHCNNLFTIPSISNYKIILKGLPQKLVSKYHISYNLILNLLKRGATTIETMSAFSHKSMVYMDIENDTFMCAREITTIKSKIESKSVFMLSSRTPRTICEKYIALNAACYSAVNKKRRDCERDIQKLEDEYRFMHGDIKLVKELIELEDLLFNEKQRMQYLKTFIPEQTRIICQFMVMRGYLNDEDSILTFSILGSIASNIAEIHPLVLSKLFVDKWSYFSEFTSKQLVGLFSCFTNVRIPCDIAVSRPDSEDAFLNRRICETDVLYHEFYDKERELGLCTGINYEDAMIFDLVDISMQWCDCVTELECKTFIQSVVADKQISIGEFTKAMLKIVTISKELVTVFERLENIDIMHKLSQIEPMVLKYITTYQSLYV
jgi:hypothetical protein